MQFLNLHSKYRCAIIFNRTDGNQILQIQASAHIEQEQEDQSTSVSSENKRSTHSIQVDITCSDMQLVIEQWLMNYQISDTCQKELFLHVWDLLLKMTWQIQGGCSLEKGSKLFVAVHDSHPLNLRASPPNCNERIIKKKLKF